MQTGKNLFVAYSMATRLPYVICDPESFNDQAWVFATEQGVKAFAQKTTREKNPVIGTKFENKGFLGFFGTLYAIGVNTVVFNSGDDRIEVELTDIAKQVDYSKMPPEARPLFNSTLQLSGIYYTQALARIVDKQEQADPDFMERRRENLEELWEEVAVNLREAQFLLVSRADPNDPKKINFPCVKGKNDQIFQPVFTDMLEVRKFIKDQKFRISKVPFEKLSQVLIPQAAGISVNPLGFNLILTKEQLEISDQEGR